MNAKSSTFWIILIFFATD